MTETYTILVAVIGVLLALTRASVGSAFGVLVLSMLLWPEFLRFPLGVVQMSVPRLIAIALIVAWIIKGHTQSIRFGKVDALVLGVWLWTVLANILAGAEFTQVTQMIGRGLDTVLMYFVARVVFASETGLKGIYVGLALAGGVMCVAGVYEAITWTSPYHVFNGGAARAAGYSEVRYGMLRAQASTLVSIYFGMAMLVILGFLISLKGFIAYRKIHVVVVALTAVAVLSSLSSGPWLGFATLLFLYLYYYKLEWIRPSLMALLLLMVVAELFSNRHFYHLIDHLALDSATAWYRTRLMEIAVTQLPEYWLFGFGGKNPNHWAALLDGRAAIDIVNNFVIVAVQGGVLALLLFVATLVMIICAGVRAFRNSTDMAQRHLLFSLLAVLIAVNFAALSVGLFGPVLLLHYLLLGACVSITAWVPSNNNAPPSEAPSFVNVPEQKVATSQRLKYRI